MIAALAAGAVDETGQPRVWFVWGNTDYRDALLDRFVASVGLPLPPRNLPLRLTLAGRRIAVFHGHEREFETLIRRVADAARERESSLQRIGGGEEADGEGSLRWEPPEFVFHGHTHVTRDETIAGVRFINPGALHRAARFTAATVDLASGEVAWVTVPAAAST